MWRIKIYYIPSNFRHVHQQRHLQTDRVPKLKILYVHKVLMENKLGLTVSGYSQYVSVRYLQGRMSKNSLYSGVSPARSGQYFMFSKSKNTISDESSLICVMPVHKNEEETICLRHAGIVSAH